MRKLICSQTYSVRLLPLTLTSKRLAENDIGTDIMMSKIVLKPYTRWRNTRPVGFCFVDAMEAAILIKNASPTMVFAIL